MAAFLPKTRESVARLEEANQRHNQTQRQVTPRGRKAYLAVMYGMTRVQALEQARISLSLARYASLIGRFGLKAAPGISPEQNLEQINQWLAHILSG